MRIRLIAALCCFAAPAAAGSFGSAARGETSAQFLELGAGARAISMGEAYSAVSDDATALYWNPAALALIQRRSISVMHAPYINGSYFDYAAYGQRWKGRAAFGASFQYFSAGRFGETDASGNDVGGINPHDLAFSVGFAYTMGGVLDGYSVGVGVKFIQSQIIRTAQTEAVDAGVLSPALFDEHLKLAFVMTNLGRPLRFEEAAAPLPFALKLGGVYKIGDYFLISSDLGLPRNDRPFLAIGSEYTLRGDGGWSFAGRAGFNSRTIGSIDGFSGASIGLGAGLNACAVDYAFVPLGAVGQAHHLSLTYNF